MALLPASALAYASFGTVKVHAGSSSLSVKVGSTVSTSISVSPSSDKQTQGCGMAECPQSCGDGCLDANGQCTCAGSSYETYRTEVSASSSNSAVVSARVSGGKLMVTGKSAGSATITVRGELRQWNSGSAKVKVTVSKASASTSSGSSSSDPAKSSTSSASSAAIPPAAAATASRDDALNEKVVKTNKGLKVYSVEVNSYLDTAAELKKVAGKKDRCIFWSGTSSAEPAYSWSFTGTDVDVKSANLEFDPTITVSDMGTGKVASIMEQARDGVVLDFAHEGQLPGKATVSAEVSKTYADGTALGLYLFDEQTGTFEKAEDGVEVENGYASVSIDHCSTWALSTDDLTVYASQELGAVAMAADSSSQGERSALPLVVIAIVVVAVAAIVLVSVLRSRRRAAAGQAGEESGPAESDEGNDRRV